MIHLDHLTSSKIDEDNFLKSFLQNQYLADVIIKGINDEIKYELTTDNKTKIWSELFTTEIEYSSVKIIDISLAKTLKINTKLTNQQE